MSRGGITLRYILALTLVALTACAGYGAARWTVGQVQSHESAMEVLAAQESRTLEIILYAEAYVEATDPSTKRNAEDQLLAYLDDLSRNHELLLHDADDSVPVEIEGHLLEEAYHHPETGLDAVIEEFQQGVRKLVALEKAQDIDEDHPHARLVLEQLPRKMMARMNAVVKVHQKHSERRVARALEWGGLSVAAVLFVLILEAVLIFRPMTRAIAEKQRALEDANVRLERLASFDHLTQVYNRTKFPEISDRERGRARREKEPLGCIMLDIDHFKQVNDTHGHAVGDTVLQRVAGTLMAETRAVDYVIRWGGEEFLVLMPGTDADQTRQAAEKLRERIAATPVENDLSVTISLGVTTTDGSEPLEEVVERADGALYAAKEKGRNRVESA